MTKKDGHCLYLRATERRKTESSRYKTRFRVIACICTRNGMSFNIIIAKQEDHRVARTNKTKLEIKILTKRQNIKSLGQILRDNESGQPNRTHKIICTNKIIRTHKIIRTNKINRTHKIIRNNKIARTVIERL